MKPLLSGLMATAIAASFAIPLPMTADAAPVYVPKSQQAGAEQARPDVQQVRRWRRAYRRNLWRDGYYNGYYGDPFYYRSYRAYRPYRYYRPYGYYRPYYRPYRYYQPPGITLWFNF